MFGATNARGSAEHLSLATAMLLFADGRTTERTVLPAEGPGRALGSADERAASSGGTHRRDRKHALSLIVPTKSLGRV
jgi:hypothetical protein